MTWVFWVIMFGNYCMSSQIHSLSLSTITWTEHNEFKYLEMRPCASYLAAKPMAKWRAGDCRGLRALTLCLWEHLRWDMASEANWRPGTGGCFLRHQALPVQSTPQNIATTFPPLPLSLHDGAWCSVVCLRCSHQQSQPTCHGVLQLTAACVTVGYHRLSQHPMPKELSQPTSCFPSTPSVDRPPG